MLYCVDENGRLKIYMDMQSTTKSIKQIAKWNEEKKRYWKIDFDYHNKEVRIIKDKIHIQRL
jgi:hypothetical protein